MVERYQAELSGDNGTVLNNVLCIEDLRRPDLQSIFGGLPIAEGVDLNLFSSLAEKGVDPEKLRSAVLSRYQGIVGIRVSAGFGDTFEVNGEVAIALLDPLLYGELVEKVDAEAKTLSVARHEAGHKFVAGNLGWHVKSVTVVPNGYYLGLTESVPPEGITFEDWLLESAAISFGGKIAALMSGDKVSGIGADMASVAAKARLVVSLHGSRFSSEEAFIREAENIASRAIAAVGTSALNRDALIVLHKQTQAA